MNRGGARGEPRLLRAQAGVAAAALGVLPDLFPMVLLRLPVRRRAPLLRLRLTAVAPAT